MERDGNKDNYPYKTICLLVKENQVLLAMKKRDWGKGRWNGPGGKPKPEESIEKAVVRETEEEVKAVPKSPVKVAHLYFSFDGKSEWNQQVVVFIAKEWVGEPSESEEMGPVKWFPFKDIPLGQMWEADRFWMPEILAGKTLKGDFIYDIDHKLQKYNLTETSF